MIKNLIDSIFIGKAADNQLEGEDGGAGSGNWGHHGRPGIRGGSGKGGGKSFREGSKETGFHKKKAESGQNGSNGSGKSGGGSSPVPAYKSKAHSGEAASWVSANGSAKKFPTFSNGTGIVKSVSFGDNPDGGRKIYSVHGYTKDITKELEKYEALKKQGAYNPIVAAQAKKLYDTKIAPFEFSSDVYAKLDESSFKSKKKLDAAYNELSNIVTKPFMLATFYPDDSGYATGVEMLKKLKSKNSSVEAMTELGAKKSMMPGESASPDKSKAPDDFDLWSLMMAQANKTPEQLEAEQKADAESKRKCNFGKPESDFPKNLQFTAKERKQIDSIDKYYENPDAPGAVFPDSVVISAIMGNTNAEALSEQSEKLQKKLDDTEKIVEEFKASGYQGKTHSYSEWQAIQSQLKSLTPEEKGEFLHSIQVGENGIQYWQKKAKFLRKQIESVELAKKNCRTACL